LQCAPKHQTSNTDSTDDTSGRERCLVCLELTARTSATNRFNRPSQALSKNVFIRADIALSALETFCSMSYISLLIYLLTYLLYFVRHTSQPHTVLYLARFIVPAPSQHRRRFLSAYWSGDG